MILGMIWALLGQISGFVSERQNPNCKTSSPAQRAWPFPSSYTLLDPRSSITIQRAFLSRHWAAWKYSLSLRRLAGRGKRAALRPRNSPASAPPLRALICRPCTRLAQRSIRAQEGKTAAKPCPIAPPGGSAVPRLPQSLFSRLCIGSSFNPRRPHGDQCCNFCTRLGCCLTRGMLSKHLFLNGRARDHVRAARRARDKAFRPPNLGSHGRQGET